MNIILVSLILSTSSLPMTAESYEPYVATAVSPNPKSVAVNTEFSCDFTVTDQDTTGNNQPIFHTDWIETGPGDCNSGTSLSWQTIQTGQTFIYRWNRKSKATPGTYSDCYKFKDTQPLGNWNDTANNWEQIVGTVVLAGGSGGGEGG